MPWVAEGLLGAPPIVFVHGAVSSRALWLPQVSRLRDRFRCVLVDLPGHGSLADLPFELDAAVEVVRAAIDAAGGRALVVGLSLGGYVSMAVAARHPERVRGLAIAGASLDATGPARLGFALYGGLLALLPERLTRRIVARLLLRRRPPEEAARIVAGLEFRHGGAAVRSLGGTSFRRLLLAYGGPILVINGDLDVAMVIGERRFVRGIEGLTRARLRAAHMSNLARPDEFSAAIAAFEATLPA
ncbi:MAG TPA: alpha/beta fold hydrolase [Candidatus Limnocylindrales bacterium]|nr:alpha/beta fold hydrolase [Candidatus Limnocylindrales bacterium]